jgi:aspartate ammonia-lyase
MTTPAEIADWLRTASFLDGLTDAHVWKLSRHVTPHELVPDETIFHEGDERQRLAILISGARRDRKGAEGRTTRLVTLAPAKRYGEGLLLDDSTHGTTARVIMPGIAVLLTRPNLEDITREAPQLYAALVARAARAISSRLRQADATLVVADGHSASAVIARAPSTISWVSVKCRSRRCMACRHCARSRTSRSPASRCASSRCSSRRWPR